MEATAAWTDARSVFETHLRDRYGVEGGINGCARWLLATDDDPAARVADLAAAVTETGVPLSSVLSAEDATVLFEALFSAASVDEPGCAAASVALLLLFDEATRCQTKVETYFDDAWGFQASGVAMDVPLQAWVLLRSLDFGRLDVARALLASSAASTHGRWISAWMQDAWTKQFRAVFFERFDKASRWRMDAAKWTQLLCDENRFGAKIEFWLNEVVRPSASPRTLASRIFKARVLPHMHVSECLVLVSLMKGAFDFFVGGGEAASASTSERVDMRAFAVFMAQYHDTIFLQSL